MREVDGRRVPLGVVVRREGLAMMSVEEIKKVIEKERRYIKRVMRDIDWAKSDIKTTRKVIKFWEGELKKAKKLEK